MYMWDSLTGRKVVNLATFPKIKKVKYERWYLNMDNIQEKMYTQNDYEEILSDANPKENFLIPYPLFHDKRYKGLSFACKVLYSILADESGLFLDNSNEALFISKRNDFAKKYDFTATTLMRQLNSLQDYGLIKVGITEQEAKDIIVINSSNQKGLGKKPCEWCGAKPLLLHKHHYPKSKVNGGENTVDICPNCHTSFHIVINSIIVYRPLLEGGIKQ